MEGEMTHMLTAAGLARVGAERPLEGKVALVITSTFGLGLGIVRRLAAEGAAIGLSGGGEPDAIAMLCQTMSARFGVRVRHDAADVAAPDAIEALIERTRRVLGSVDI